jgi:hypothetical protein
MAGWLTIARQEFRSLLRDHRFRWLCSAVGLCLLAVLIVGWQQTQRVRAQRTAANAIAREHWVTQPPKNPHAAAHYGVYAFKPQTALAFVDIGIDEHAGVVAFLEAHKRHDLTGTAAQDGRTQRLLALTAAGVLQYLLPLLIIVLAFDALAGEREQGTLRYLLSLGVHPRTLLAGKLAGIGAALGVALLPAVVGSVLLLWWLEDAPWDFVRMALMAVSYLLYGFIFLALTLAASSRWSARMTLLGMLTFWAVSSFVVPRMVTDLAARWYPTPARAAFDAAVAHDIKQGIDGHNPQEERLKAFEAKLLAQYNAKRLEDLPINPAGLLMQESEEHSNQVYAHHYARLWSVFERQVTLHNAAAIVAPVLAVRSVSMALAGTDVFHHLDFADAAERYRQLLVKTLNEDWAYNSTPATGETYVADARLWTSIQPFTYTPPSLALKQQWLALAWLGGWLGFSLLAISSAARGLTAVT